tara:strand:+ start:3483 stop:4745 length:1263 start_codon:yes stop_codon:yes gene_type:complete
MKKIIEKVVPLVEISSEESKKLKDVLKEFEDKVNSALKKKKVNATLFLGGSIGKGTCLPGIHDIDYFMRFDLKKYGEEDISQICGETLALAFKKIVRLKGSRDYYQIMMKGYEFEVIPVLKITHASQAKNITDHSPFHVNWMKKQLKSRKTLDLEMRLAKQFFRAAGVYGAESWIGGFSGHSIEILVVHYGSFEKLVKAVVKWGDKEVIDVEKKYKKKIDILEILGEAKTQSPLVLVDPVEAERNASAALSQEKYDLFKNWASSFLKNPSARAFEEVEIGVEDIKKLGKGKKLFIFRTKPTSEKLDISGARMVKELENVVRLFKEKGFSVLDEGMYWNKKDDGLIWVVLDKKDLPKKYVFKGPPTFSPTINIRNFKTKYARKKVWREGYNYYVELTRKQTKAEQIVRLIKKEFPGLKLVK